MIRLVAICFLLTVLPHGPAMAGDKARASALFAQGNKLRVAKQYAEALEKYRAAYRLLPSLKIDYNIALTLEKMGRHAESARAYRRFMMARGGKVHERQISRARGKLNALAKKIAILEISCPAAGALVKVDGRVVGKIPLGKVLFLEPGRRAVKVEHGERGSYERSLDLGPGQRRSVEASLERPEPSASQPAPQLIQEGVGERDAGGGKTTWAWSTLGVGLACAAGAGVFYGLGASRTSAAYDRYNALTSADSAESFDARWAEVEASGRLYFGGHVLAGVAAAALGVSIYMFITRPDEGEAAASTAPPTFNVSPGPGGLGFNIAGSF